MKISRVRVADMMVVVALAAVDLAALRTPPRYTVLVAGILPMTNILTIAYLIWSRRYGPFLAGVLLFGASGMAIFAAIEGSFPSLTMELYLARLLDPLWEAIGWERPETIAVASMLAGVVLLSVPQLALATIGGLFCWCLPAPARRYTVLGFASVCVLAVVPFAVDQCRVGKVTVCNCVKVVPGMTIPQAEAILGPGLEVSEGYVPTDFLPDGTVGLVVHGATYRVWRSERGSRLYWAGIRDGRIVELCNWTLSPFAQYNWPTSPWQ